GRRRRRGTRGRCRHRRRDRRPSRRDRAAPARDRRGRPGRRPATAGLPGHRRSPRWPLGSDVTRSDRRAGRHHRPGNGAHTMTLPHLLAQSSPTQDWITGWTMFLRQTLPMVFLVVVILVGTILIVRARGGLQKAIIFGIGAALVYLILTNVDAMSRLFEQELPIPEGDR